MSGWFVRNVFQRDRTRCERTSMDLIAAWLGAARLNGEPCGPLAKRVFRRWPSQKAVLLWLDDDESLPVRAFDLSGGGAGFLVPRRLKPGLPVRISAAEDECGEACVEARVVYTLGSNADGCFPTGVEFVGLGD